MKSCYCRVDDKNKEKYKSLDILNPSKSKQKDILRHSVFRVSWTITMRCISETEWTLVIVKMTARCGLITAHCQPTLFYCRSQEPGAKPELRLSCPVTTQAPRQRQDACWPLSHQSSGDNNIAPTIISEQYVNYCEEGLIHSILSCLYGRWERIEN